MHGGEKTKLKDQKLALWECNLHNMEADDETFIEEPRSNDDHSRLDSMSRDIESIDTDDKKIKIKIRKIVNRRGASLNKVKNTVRFKKPKKNSSKPVFGKDEALPPMTSRLSKMATNDMPGEDDNAMGNNQIDQDMLQMDNKAKENDNQMENDSPFNLDIVKVEAPLDSSFHEEDRESIQVIEEFHQGNLHQPQNREGQDRSVSKTMDLSIGAKVGNPVEIEEAATEMMPSYADIVQGKVKPGVQATLPRGDTPILVPINGATFQPAPRTRRRTPDPGQLSPNFSSVPLFNIQAERDQLAHQLINSLQRINELTSSLISMSSAFNKMEERIRSAEKDLDSHSLAIANMQRRLSKSEHTAMPGYVESLIINPDPTKMLKIVKTGDIYQLARNELIFADSLLMMTFRISTIIFDILR